MNIQDLLIQCIEQKASDLHLSAGLPPMLRIHGDLIRISEATLSHESIRSAVMGIMNEPQRAHFESQMECDFSFEVNGVSRFRTNVFMQTRGIGAAFRAIPSQMPTLESLSCPKIFTTLLDKPRGLILVTGQTGSGKSTTLAAMVNALNHSKALHILTIEDPVEFVHQPDKCLVNQREIGSQTHSFANALRSAMREDPDVILVGEMRDLETIRLALTAAETGHLVFGTLHTAGAAKTIDRIIDVFPAEEKEMVRAMLSESLEAVISQVLCKRKDGKGRIAAYEIMLGSQAIRSLIREGKVAQMYSAMQMGSNAGMQTLDQALQQLLTQGLIALADARSKAKFPETISG